MSDRPQFPAQLPNQSRDTSGQVSNKLEELLDKGIPFLDLNQVESIDFHTDREFLFDISVGDRYELGRLLPNVYDPAFLHVSVRNGVARVVSFTHVAATGDFREQTNIMSQKFNQFIELTKDKFENIRFYAVLTVQKGQFNTISVAPTLLISSDELSKFQKLYEELGARVFLIGDKRFVSTIVVSIINILLMRLKGSRITLIQDNPTIQSALEKIDDLEEA